jgi:hypothetical protein
MTNTINHDNNIKPKQVCCLMVVILSGRGGSATICSVLMDVAAPYSSVVKSERKLCSHNFLQMHGKEIVPTHGSRRRDPRSLAESRPSLHQFLRRKGKRMQRSPGSCVPGCHSEQAPWRCSHVRARFLHGRTRRQRERS